MNNLSIVLCTYNEEKFINKTLQNLLDKEIVKEIIIVDDFSTDGTREIIKKKLEGKIDKLLLNNKNFGKGYSIRQGIEISTGDIILIQDADLEYDPSDYFKLIDPIKKGYADVVYGSRFVGSEEKRVLFFWHSIGNFILTFLSNMFSNLNLTDMETCYKMFRREILDKFDLRSNRFGFEPEFTAKIAKAKLRIYELPISYYGRTYGDGKKGFIDKEDLSYLNLA